MLASYAANGTLTARYLTPGLDENVSMTSGGSTYYYMADGLGSVRNVVDGSQVTQNTYDYYAFGSELAATQGVTSPYQFTGREREAGGVLSQHYYRNRYYLPALGIFAARDAFWADPHQGWGYVKNAPIYLPDPFGLQEDHGGNDSEGSIWDMFQAMWEWLNDCPNGSNPLGWVDNPNIATDPDANVVQPSGREYDPELAAENADAIHDLLQAGGTIPGAGVVFDAAAAGLSYVGDDNEQAAKDLALGALPLAAGALGHVFDKAAELGYKRVKDVPFWNHRQPTFRKGGRYISYDADQHKGGFWKMFDRKGNRLGTWDADLKNRVDD